MWRGCRVLLVVSVTMTCLAVDASAPVAQGMRPTPPIPPQAPIDLKDPEAIAAGASLFRRTCTGYCHGSEGRISRAPSLRGKEHDPRSLYLRIAGGGAPGSVAPMPAFQGVLPPEDIWKLVAYIMSLRDAKD